MICFWIHMKLTSLFCGIALLFLASCTGSHLDGTSPEKFKASSEKLSTELSASKKENFEKAMRVLLLSAMRAKFAKPEEFKGKSFDEIVMQKVNGKTYSEVVEMAETHLQETNKNEIAALEKEISAMKKSKAGYDKIKSKLDLIKGRLIKMDLKNGYPVAFIEFKNVSKKMFDSYSYTMVARTDSGKLIASASRSFSGVGTIMPNDVIPAELEISDYYMTNTPEIDWKSIKYPVTDPEKYHIKIEGYTDQLVVDDVNYDININDSGWKMENQKAYEQLEEKLKVLKASKGTLDEVELTKP